MASTRNETGDAPSPTEPEGSHPHALRLSLVILWVAGVLAVTTMVWQVLRVSHDVDVWLALLSMIVAMPSFAYFDVTAARAGRPWWLSLSAPYLPLLALAIGGYSAGGISVFGWVWLEVFLVFVVVSAYVPTRALLVARAE